ncbi:MAG: PadR family transcriptional regulator [Treponemataceae bacterium]|nr:PadR family transcriptional regulator [Treponemataceae bacterium]
MSAIDLVILGMLKKKPMGAYELQKLVEYRSISKWVKISTPSIYKKVLQLEENGFVTSRFEREGNMPEKAVYSLTDEGKKEFERLMLDLSRRPVRLFLDCNAVAVNMDSLPKRKRQECVRNIARSVQELKAELAANLAQKQDAPDVPSAGMAVLRQQLLLADALEQWAETLQAQGEKK